MNITLLCLPISTRALFSAIGWGRFGTGSGPLSLTCTTQLWAGRPVSPVTPLAIHCENETYLSKKANLVTEMSMQRCPLPIFCWWSDATELSAHLQNYGFMVFKGKKKNTLNVWEKPESVTILTKKTLLTPTIFRYFLLILVRFFTWASLRVTRPSLIRSSRTVFPTMFRAGIGTGSWSRMESTAAGPGTFPPFCPLGPASIDWNHFINRLRIRCHNITR